MPDPTKHLPVEQIERMFKDKNPAALAELKKYQLHGDAAKAESLLHRIGYFKAESAGAGKDNSLLATVNITLNHLSHLADEKPEPELVEAITEAGDALKKGESRDAVLSTLADKIEKQGGTFGPPVAAILHVAIGKKSQAPHVAPNAKEAANAGDDSKDKGKGKK